ncbi:nucleolar DEAD-box protein required for synthesis of 60S ribosomal subunit [Lecanora helva]
MAPLRVYTEEGDDDFVRTISDSDLAHDQTAGEEDSPFDNSTKNAQKGKKRKRLNKGEEEVGVAASKKVKKGTEMFAHNLQPLRSRAGSVEAEEQTWTAGGEDDGIMDSDFEFQVGDVENGLVDDFDAWDFKEEPAPPETRGEQRGVDIDEIIARRKKNGSEQHADTNGDNETESLPESESDVDQAIDDRNGSDMENEEDETLADDAFGMGVPDFDEGPSAEDGAEDKAPELESEEESVAEPMPHPADLEGQASSADEMDDPTERAKREAFFAPEEEIVKPKPRALISSSFQNMSLSRPILRGLAAAGFSEPTPIQNKTIPVALMGKDVVGGAVTGSGKTAAFILPILERLLYRPKKIPTSRVAILMPTRELAVQCYNVAVKLASFTDITFCQLVGGFSLREQENRLRQRPDVIIATPGRFIDHMRNSASFTVDTLEIMVLDEADRMLEDGFADELNEILSSIPKSRQTMLFSATMTDRVDKLIRLGLNNPVRLIVDARKQTVTTLTQEFVRLRPGREDKRLGYLMYLSQNIYTDRVIIFLRQKKEAHRVRVIFGLCGIKATELHGSMSQEQRISALTSFRTGKSTHLLATDLASRGLDIANVTTVINYEAPQSHEIYLHRVGRTARAGRAGRSCTLAAEPDRKIVKQAVKAAKAQGAKIVSRVVAPALADEWAAKCAALDAEVEEILKEEKEEKLLSGAEMQVRKSENLMKHEDEIKARPKRTWFESEREKLLAKRKGQVELNGAVGLGKKAAQGGKLSHKDKKRLDVGRERKEGKVWKKGRGDAYGVGSGRGKGGEGGRGGRGRGERRWVGRRRRGRVVACEGRDSAFTRYKMKTNDLS